MIYFWTMQHPGGTNFPKSDVAWKFPVCAVLIEISVDATQPPLLSCWQLPFLSYQLLSPREKQPQQNYIFTFKKLFWNSSMIILDLSSFGDNKLQITNKNLNLYFRDSSFFPLDVYKSYEGQSPSNNWVGQGSVRGKRDWKGSTTSGFKDLGKQFWLWLPLLCFLKEPFQSELWWANFEASFEANFEASFEANCDGRQRGGRLVDQQNPRRDSKLSNPHNCRSLRQVLYCIRLYCMVWHGIS